MNELKVFQSADFGEVRTVLKDGEPWFVAADVCRALEIQNPTDAIKKLDDDEKARLNLGLSGGDTNCISESGLYSLVLGSRKPEARAFKRWITHEVIPSIRQHGAYMTPEAIAKALMTPDGAITLLTVLRDAQEKNRTLATENALLSEQVLRWDSKAFISAAVRAFAQSVKCKPSDKFSYAWIIFKKELLYRHGINLNTRVTEYLNRTGKRTPPKTLDMMSDGEIPKAVSTIVALCRENEVNIDDLLKKIDATA